MAITQKLPKIAIIGAGPAGLTLSRILLNKSIPSIIFEGEESSTARTQGGSLDLHPKTGQAALREAGLLDEFIKHSRPEDQYFVLKDRFNQNHVVLADMDIGKPEIDRMQLRQILLDSLPKESIRWGHRVKSVEMGTVHFTNKPSATGFDLIVGADGAWSKVRPLVSHAPPFYTGVSGFEIVHRDPEKNQPELASLIPRGSMFVFGEEQRKVFLSQRQSDRSLRTYAVMHKPETYLKTMDLENPETIREALLEEYKEFDSEIQRLITDFDTSKGDSLTSRALYMLPPALTWPTRPGVTLIGDSAHLMSPFTGQGVNIAMTDALELARAITKYWPEDLSKAVGEYENSMFKRAEEATWKTWKATLSRFQEGGLGEMASRMGRMAKAAGSP